MRIVSDVPVVASQRMIYGPSAAPYSYSEMMGLSWKLVTEVSPPTTTTVQNTTWAKYYAGHSISRTCQGTACADPTYFLADHLGSTSIATNNYGGKISEVQYDPWGQTRYTANGSMPTSYTYTGQRTFMSDDPATTDVTEGFGSMYYNARWYDPISAVVPLSRAGQRESRAHPTPA